MNKKSHGFTIVELVIATSVFGLILLVALAGFTGIGSMFYKGVAVTRVQAVSSRIVDSVKNDIQFASSVVGPSTSSQGLKFYCVGGSRYIYNLNYEYDGSRAESATNFGLIKDVLPGSGACSPPCYSVCGANETRISKPQEILSDKMRLVQFQIVPGSSQLYTVYVNLAYGDDDAFSNLGNAANMDCKGGLTAQRFCAIIRNTSSTYMGIHK